MNIIMIGNGFDLAHGLPTKYTDFLEFVKVIRQVIKSEGDVSNLNWGNISPQIREIVENNLKNISSSQVPVWNNLLSGNIWIDYFFQCPEYQKDNWVDFENEISSVIQCIDKHMQYANDDSKLEDIFKKIINGFSHEHSCDLSMDYQKLRDRLLSDLNKLIRALEIYLCEYIEKIECKKISPDIKEIMAYSFEYADKSTKNKISKVLNFNYTSTYNKIYFSNLHKLVENEADEDYIHYIHGEADINHTIETNNMVLGIDEYLPDDRKDRDIEFIAFKKFYQRIYKRIYKRTGNKYKEWVDSIRKDYETNKRAEEECIELIRDALKKGDMDSALKWQKASEKNYAGKTKQHKLYIFGHSLNVTDKDILRELILNDNVYTTIYYHKTDDSNGGDDGGRIDLGEKIANLVKIIGQDELIRRTGEGTKTIEFKLQQDMMEIEN